MRERLTPVDGKSRETADVNKGRRTSRAPEYRECSLHLGRKVWATMERKEVEQREGKSILARKK